MNYLNKSPSWYLQYMNHMFFFVVPGGSTKVTPKHDKHQTRCLGSRLVTCTPLTSWGNAHFEDLHMLGMSPVPKSLNAITLSDQNFGHLKTHTNYQKKPSFVHQTPNFVNILPEPFSSLPTIGKLFQWSPVSRPWILLRHPASEPSLPSKAPRQRQLGVSVRTSDLFEPMFFFASFPFFVRFFENIFFVSKMLKRHI